MDSCRSFQEIRKHLYSGSTTCERIVSRYLEKIANAASLNAFVDVYADEALERAGKIDKKLSEGHAGSLAGMVVGLKDMIAYGNHPLEASSRMLKGYISPFSATAVQRLLSEDAIVIGRLNCDEFGMGSSNEHSAHGPVLHSIDERYVPGGSSGGSAVAVQAGLCTTSLGSDTGGSVRQPAAFCGVVGCKPTYSRVSRYGLVAFASSLDCIGVISSTVEDNAILLKVIAGHDPNDATSSQRSVDDYTAAGSQPATPCRIGWFEESLDPAAMDRDVRHDFVRTLDKLEAQGHIVEKLRFPLAPYVLPTYYILSTAEASSNLARYDGIRYGQGSQHGDRPLSSVNASRSSGFGAEVKRRILTGTYVLSADHHERYYSRASKVRSAIVRYTRRVFRDVDFVVTPTAPSTAFLRGKRLDNPLEMYNCDRFTVHASLSGNPAISLPNGSGDNGMPTGLQLMADHFKEGALYAFARRYLNQKSST